MIDLTNCDQEPIHLLGKIQSIGHLLAVEIDSKKVAFVSEGTESSWGFEDKEIFSADLSKVFGKSFMAEIDAFCTTSQRYCLVKSLVKVNDLHYQAILSKSKEYILVELEEIKQVDGYHEEIIRDLGTIDDSIRVFGNSKSLGQIVNNAASLLQKYTGFERVMVYEFDSEDNGKVIAEEKSFGLEPFLGLHYPATDIPEQARKLYLKNKVRAIYDVEDPGKNLFALDGKHAESKLDLTHSVFRSVSPVHIQYLKNMGVKSTHGVSLIVNKKLWGMLLCQHYSEPKFLGINQRLTTQLFGDYLSSRIAILEAEANAKDLEMLNKAMSGLRYSQHEDLALALNEQWPVLSKLFGCHSYYYSSNIGSFQPNEEVSDQQMKVVESAMDYNREVVYATKSLGYEGLTELENFPFSGFLRLTISQESQEFLYLFRKEKKKTIHWAGNPNEAVQVDENDPSKLSPRNSFEKWEQSVEGESEEWSHRNIVHAYTLRDSLISFQVENSPKAYSSLNDDEEANVQLKNILKERYKELSRLNAQLKDELEEKEKVNKSLRIAKEAAEQMHKIRSDFPANLSHEIRTPLNGIMGLSLMIQENSATPELKEFAALQIESTKRMTKTLNRVLELAKIQNNGTKPLFDTFQIKDFIESIVPPLKSQAQKKNQKLLIINHEAGTSIISDQVLLEQIIVNLVTNAIKYTPEEGVIQLNIKIISKNVREILEITVEDNGIGISEENLENIFEPFFQESEVTKQRDNSSGLGLYLVKKYTEYLNGRVILESEKGEGTMFVLQIPLA